MKEGDGGAEQKKLQKHFVFRFDDNQMQNDCVARSTISPLAAEGWKVKASSFFSYYVEDIGM